MSVSHMLKVMEWLHEEPPTANTLKLLAAFADAINRARGVIVLGPVLQ